MHTYIWPSPITLHFCFHLLICTQNSHHRLKDIDAIYFNFLFVFFCSKHRPHPSNKSMVEEIISVLHKHTPVPENLNFHIFSCICTPRVFEILNNEFRCGDLQIKFFRHANRTNLAFRVTIHFYICESIMY